MTRIVVTFDSNGLPERYLRARDTAIRPELVAMVDRLTDRGVKESKQRVRKDTMALRDSIRKDRARWIGDRAVGGWGTDSPYGETSEKGRRPGRPMPPKGVLLGWMGRKGIPASAEFVVRRAIGRKGIAAQPFMAPGEDEVRRAIPAEKQITARRIVARVSGGR